MKPIFFKPDDAVCADFIPYMENGVYYLYYLKDYRDIPSRGEGTPWFLTTTRDFMTFEDKGEALARGSRDDQDLYVFTGSVTKINELYHIYYTGHNPHLRERGKPEQAVMHAVSGDLLHWEKRPEDTFFAPSEGYEPHDWRDPFVFYDEDAHLWRMLLAARHTAGASRRRGLTAMCVSRDGFTWRVAEPFWTPGAFSTHECPDLFRLGDWYYLLYSEFSEEKLTRYRMSRHLEGPWLAPPDDRLDGVAYYAAKSAPSERGRYLFGWIPTRHGETDRGRWEWGGCLCVHELLQNADGTLRVQMPAAIRSAVIARSTAQTVALTAEDGFQSRSMGTLPDRFTLSARLRIDARNAGLLLHADETMEKGVYLRLEPHKQRFVLDMWPRNAECAFEIGLERPLPPPENDGYYHLDVLCDGSAACVYINDTVAMSFRTYAQNDARWGAFVCDGSLSMEASVSL